MGTLFCLQPVFAEQLLPGADCSFWCRRKQEIASPWTTGARLPLLLGTGTALTLLLFEDQIVDPTQKEVTEDKPLGKWSKVGDLGGQLVPNAAYLVGMMADYWFTGSDKSLSRADVMFKATAYSGLTTILLKQIVREPRPYSNSDKTSFPSGHATTAFAFAAAVQQMHGWWWGTPAYALATFVGFSRINDNKHFLHDVVAGATIGLSFGIGISQEAGRSVNQVARASSSFFLVPSDDLDGVLAYYSLSF